MTAVAAHAVLPPFEVRSVVLPDLPPKIYESKLPTRSVVRPSLVLVSISLLFAVAVLSGCAPSDDNRHLVYRLPWMDASGGYSIQDIELSTFQEPESLRGSSGEVVVDPVLASGTIKANEPIGRWIRDGNRMIPADFVTQQAATLYAHLEKLAAIDAATNVASKMQGPSRIGLLVRVSETSTSPMILNNAVYDGRLDALLIVPYASELLPISQNAGVIGHEHFHRVFQSIVLKPIRELARNGATVLDDESPCAGGIVEKRRDQSEESTDPTNDGLVPLKILNQTMIRGVNEGFADFWGWAYSRDEEFVSRSLGVREDAARRLDKPVSNLPQKLAFRNSLFTVNRAGLPVLKSEGARVAAAYRIGTEYARILRGVVEALVSNGPMGRDAAVEKVRMALAESLSSLSSDVVGSYTRDELDPELLLKPFFTKLIRMSSTGPAVLDASSAKAVCDELSRLQASANMTSGLCEAKTPATTKSTTTTPKPSVKQLDAAT